MYKLSTPFQDYTLCRRHECADCASPFVPGDAFAVDYWLRGFRHDSATMELLRRAVFEYADSAGAPKTSDEEVLVALAALIVAGVVVVCGGPVVQKGGGGGGGGVEPKPDEPDPPKPRPQPEEEPKGNLFVEVYDDAGELITEEVEITATGPESLKITTTAGSHTFRSVNPGIYSVTATVPKDYFKKTSQTKSSSTVPVGGTGKARLDFVWLLNTITPKLELEYKVVLMDPKLSGFLTGSETPIVTDDATRIEVSATETTGTPPYLGEGTIEAANCDVFRDEACKTPLVGKIPKAELLGGPLSLWLKAKTPGKFTAKLTLDPSSNGHVTVKGPAEEEMGVVEVEMTLLQHDISALDGINDLNPDVEPESTYHTALKDKALPAQKEMSAAHKVNRGRVLHVQDAGHHGRAKLVVAKLKADQWPAGTDDYDLILTEDGRGSALALHGHETNDDAKVLPLKTKVSALKAAEQTFWVEGTSASAARRDARLALGMNRGPGGIAWKEKANANWARFTVVKIEEVKVHYVKPGDEHRAWDATHKRFHINLNKKGDAAGRKVKISVKLSTELRNIPIRVMLAPDKDNRKAANWNIDFPSDGKNGTADVKWKDVPAALKQIDRSSRKGLMHLGKATDAKGVAEVELSLSRCGGDKFHPAAYIEQDPHLAKYVHGVADLEKRLPKIAAAPVQVWRKVFYQVTRPVATARPTDVGFVASQQKVFLDPVFTEEKTMSATDFTVNPFREEWQFRAGGSTTQRLCIGTHNVAKTDTLFVKQTKETSPKFHLVFCDEQFDADIVSDSKDVVFNKNFKVARDVELKLNGTAHRKLTILNPPLQGGALMVVGTWVQREFVKPWFSANHWEDGDPQPIPANCVTIQQTRANVRVVHVAPPPGAKMDSTHEIVLTIQLKAANGPWDGWAPNNSVTNVVREGGYAPQKIDGTIAHELGHLFGRVRHTRITGLPDHPMYYQARGGSGTHCAIGATWTPDPTEVPQLNPNAANQKDAQGHASGRYDDGDCILFGISSASKREWCKHCALDFTFADLSKFG